jgi:hypothetical protein
MCSKPFLRFGQTSLGFPASRARLSSSLMGYLSGFNKVNGESPNLNDHKIRFLPVGRTENSLMTFS